MCLIFFSFHHHPNYKLVVAANRDEFYKRKTSPANYWQDKPQILGGRDLEAGGTWMGISTVGRLSLVTNYRDLKNLRANAPSRGHLVSDFLESVSTPKEYLEDVKKNGQAYNGFNLLVGDLNEIWYYSNYKSGPEKVKPGFYGLSNHLLDTPWPKVVRGKQKLQPAFESPLIDHNQLLDLLHDEAQAPDEKLPDTGVGLERERMLSAMFIKSADYGTRCSTVITVDQSNHVRFTERGYNLTNFTHTQKEFEFKI